MKKIIAFIFIFILSLGFFSNKAYAYQYAGNCPDLTQIPISVAPQSGSQTTQFKVTLFWSQLSKDAFNKYKDIDISIVTDIQGKPNTNATDQSYTRTAQVDRTQTLSNFFIIAGTYDVSVHLNTDVYGACKNYEANPVSITLQSTAVNNPSSGTTSGLNPGDICSPDLQNNSQYACPTNDPCTKISLEWKCSAPTPTSTPNANLCCPAGFGTGELDCPGFIDINVKCCRRFGISNYETIDKPQCGSTITGNFCCPSGYGTSDSDCQMGVDRTKQCCKRVNILGGSEQVNKNTCTLQAGPGPIPLPPCATGLDTNGKTTTDKTGPNAIVSCSTIDTALGPIDTNPTGFVKSIFGIVLSLAGGVALILIMISGYRLMASQGNPEKVKEAQESLTSAIVGLLFIIFSITILQIVGVDILHIPGFTK